MQAHGTMLVGALDAKSAMVDMAMFQASGARLVIAAQDGRRTAPIGKMETTVGREEGDVVIAHPSVSKNHAKITFQGGRFFVEDLKSSNGTFVDGARVDGRAPLTNQGTVTFGTSSTTRLNGRFAVEGMTLILKWADGREDRRTLFVASSGEQIGLICINNEVFSG